MSHQVLIFVPRAVSEESDKVQIELHIK